MALTSVDCIVKYGRVNVSLDSFRQIYAPESRCYGVYVRGNRGYMETSRIVIGQLCIFCNFSYIISTHGSIVDMEDNREQVEKALSNPPQ